MGDRAGPAHASLQRLTLLVRLHVAFLPNLVVPGRQVCIVVDVIRASTSLVVLLERGASKVFIAADVETARQMAPHRPGAVLAGEEQGLAPRGFEYGNSPVELSRAEVAGREVIFVTTNGTAAIRAVERNGPVLVGALRNGAAVCREALESAQGMEADLTVVCAGREGAFGIDDAYTAGSFVDRFHEAGPFALSDAAQAAWRLYRSEADPLPLFRESAAGQNVIRLGLAHDVDFCAQREQSTAVPRLGRELVLIESGRGV